MTLVEVGQCARNLLSYLKEGTGMHLMRGETMTIKQVAERVANVYGARVEVVYDGEKKARRSSPLD